MVSWVWILLGLPGVSLVVASFAWVLIEWIWRPWRLVVSCRKQEIPGFPFVPFVGQLPQISKALRADSAYEWEALSSAQKCLETHGRVFYFIAGKTVTLCIADPDLVKDILATNADCYAKPSFIRIVNILGDGLFASSGQVWSKQRQLLGLSFRNKEIKTEVGMIARHTRAALDKWLLDINHKSGELAVYKRFLELTLDIIRKVAFAPEPPGSEDKASPVIARAFDRYLHHCRELVFDPISALTAYRWLPTTSNREICKDRKCLSNVVEEIIQARSKAYSSSTSEGMNHKNVMDLLMDGVRGTDSRGMIISSQQVRDNVMTILLAGHHTIASLLAWTMYMLALHPLWQERARSEVEEFCRDGVVETATLPHLKTITMVLQETLRLFPPVPLIGRLCVKENSVGPFLIREQLEIFIPTAVIHRDKLIWGEDADEFVPMRFADGIGKACKHHLGYLPFGYGPRTCIGQTLALVEARAVLAVILPVVSWRLGPGYRHCPNVSLTLQPKFDIPIIMEKL